MLIAKFMVIVAPLEERRARVAANGRPLERAGDLARRMEQRFAEHSRGLFADRTRPGASISGRMSEVVRH